MAACGARVDIDRDRRSGRHLTPSLSGARFKHFAAVLKEINPPSQPVFRMGVPAELTVEKLSGE